MFSTFGDFTESRQSFCYLHFTWNADGRTSSAFANTTVDGLLWQNTRFLCKPFYTELLALQEDGNLCDKERTLQILKFIASRKG